MPLFSLAMGILGHRHRNVSSANHQRLLSGARWGGGVGSGGSAARRANKHRGSDPSVRREESNARPETEAVMKGIILLQVGFLGGERRCVWWGTGEEGGGEEGRRGRCSFLLFLLLALICDAKSSFSSRDTFTVRLVEDVRRRIPIRFFCSRLKGLVDDTCADE